jgi:hypothetical protein
MKGVTSAALLLVILLSLAVAAAPTASLPAAPGDTIVVTSAADHGADTLRQALLEAQSGDTITFDTSVFPPTAPVSISLTSALPHVHQGNLTLDASDAGVILDGTSLPGTWVAGLVVDSNGNRVQGLQVSNFSGPGIAISGAYNQIGGDRSVGAGPHGQGNLTSHNDVGIGLWGSGVYSNTITGNVIGCQLFGGDDSGNRFGVEISEGANGNVLGPDNVIAFNDGGVHLHQGANGNVIGPDNQIAYNGGAGIDVEHPETLHNAITQNSIHDNGGMGIRLSDGGNTELAAPAIADFDLGAGTTTGTTCAWCSVEVFSDSSDEGAIYEGRTRADVTGAFTFDKGASLAGPHLTATATDASGNTSEFSPPAHEPATIVVTSTADSGAGTLRQGLLDAQCGDTITFDPTVFPPSAPVTISVTSALPQLQQGNLTVDGSNAGVILDGGSIPTDTWAFGLEITSSGNTVRALQIVYFPGPGLGLHSGGRDNTIGGDRAVGTAALGQGNLISRNRNVGISLGDSSFNTIRGNYIGTDPSGTEAWGNRYEGVYITGGSHNQILDNLISDNGADGVGIQGSQSSYNVTSGNTIGTGAGMEDPLGNHSSGISIEQGACNNTVGPDNVIAHSDLGGVEVYGPSSLGNTVAQNTIHDNGSLGIDLWGGGNMEFASPIIFDFDVSTGSVTGLACPSCTVEVFSTSSDEGDVYEGQTTADDAGTFAFINGSSFAGPILTATATDTDGNTSEFSLPTAGTSGSLILQEGNPLPKTLFASRQSGDLDDNRIASHWQGLWAFHTPLSELRNETLYIGAKRYRLAINNGDQDKVDWSKPEFSVDPAHDQFVTDLAENGIQMTYFLSFWDKATYPGGVGYPCPRFQTEPEIERYLDFVRFIVGHFKDGVQTYEIWNEPDVPVCAQYLAVEDYVELVRRAVPVLRDEYSEAKIQVGGTTGLSNPESQAYLFAILESDVMPLVDVVSWHPFYGESPETHHEYYYAYADIVQEIKDVAAAHGFTGEYEADEMNWRSSTDPSHDGPWSYPETVCAKYHARENVRHLGMDVIAGNLRIDHSYAASTAAVRNLATLMAGAQPADMSLSVQTTVTDVVVNVVTYTFSLPGDHLLVGLWTDGIALEYDPGSTTTVTLPGLTDHSVKGIDVLHGFEQPLITREERGDLVIRDLLVKDYPIVLQVSPIRRVFLPLVLRAHPR